MSPDYQWLWVAHNNKIKIKIKDGKHEVKALLCQRSGWRPRSSQFQTTTQSGVYRSEGGVWGFILESRSDYRESTLQGFWDMRLFN